MVTATLHKITAGDGFEYYTRQVAAHDATERGRSPLGAFYSTRGEAPGRWMGSGLKGLSVKYRSRRMKVSRVKAGSVVTEGQMKSLFGLGRHPQAEPIAEYVVGKEVARGAKRRLAKRAAEQYGQLGAPFRIYEGASEYRKRCAKAFSEYNQANGQPKYAPIPDAERAAIRTATARRMFREELGRDPLDVRELSGWVARRGRQRTTAVAGYDWTFSPVKSFSVLWAVASPELREKLEAAHHAAVGVAFDYLETNATYTRLGRNGVRQVEADGLIAAIFDHRSSRCHDPDFHSHVVVANRVRTRVHGRWRWRALDGTMFYRAAVTASEIYNTALELYSEELAGLRFSERGDAKPGKRPVREVVGVDPKLSEFWSKRDATISVRIGQLSIQFQNEHRREPTAVEMYKLAQQAILETRERKHLPPSPEQDFTRWDEEAQTTLGGTETVEAMVTTATSQPPRRRPTPDAVLIAKYATEVLATVAEERSTWRYSHVRNETERRIRGLVDRSNWESVSAAIVEEALSPRRSIARGDPDISSQPELRSIPQTYQRTDGTSAYKTAGSQLYTSPEILDIEARLVEMALDKGGRAIAPELVTAAAAAHNQQPGNEHKQLNAGQLATVMSFATTGVRLQIANAPAGTGKTAAMKVLTEAWRSSGGTVLGLAPTARAAKELQDEIDTRVATVDKVLHVLAQHTPTLERIAFEPARPPPNLPEWVLQIDRNTLVIVDEHVQIADRKRLRMLLFLLMRNATVRFVGDDMQLPAIDAGGAVADIIQATEADVQTLTHVVRFTDPAESRATLLVRQGHAAGLGYYLDHSRVHVGTLAAGIDAAFAGWLADRAADRDTIMLAARHEIVAELNKLAREDRLSRCPEPPTREVELADTLKAGVGDTVRTGRNAPKLVLAGGDYVRNGYQWTVAAVHLDGSLTVTLITDRGDGPQVHLPAEYVTHHVRLGYAATINSVQGLTAGTSHSVLTGEESRYQLYVALTRGRARNDIYITTAIDGSEESFLTEQAVLPRTGVDRLVRVLGRDNAPKSAHQELRHAADPWQRLSGAVDIYLDALDEAIIHALGFAAVAQLDARVEQVHPGLTHDRDYPDLRRRLIVLILDGHDAVAALERAIADRELQTADHAAAVLDWRLAATVAGSLPPGPLPWLPGIPLSLACSPDIGAFLTARSRIITELAERIREEAEQFTPGKTPPWARPLAGTRPALVADLAVWRAATHVAREDLRPCGPPRRSGAEQTHYHSLLTRVNDAIGDANLAVNKWSPVAKRIDIRILSDPFWPELATHLETADKAGIPVDDDLAAAAALRPLPDELPAAALWSRLDWEPSALDTPTSGSPLNPELAAELEAVIGAEAAARVTADPAWPKVVAAVERASSSPWTSRELLDVASELIDGGLTEDDRLRPDQYATALAWRIDALVHQGPRYPDTGPEEPPVDLEEPGFGDPYPEDIDDQYQHPEDSMVEEPHAPSDTPPGPAPGHTSPADHTPTGPGDLPEEIRQVTALFKSGDLAAGVRALERVPDHDRRTMRRVASTLTTYAFPVARARLKRAAQQNPELRAIIEACTPTTDPGLYRPARNHDGWQPPRDSRRRVDRSRQIPPEQRRPGYSSADRYFENRPDLTDPWAGDKLPRRADPNQQNETERPDDITRRWSGDRKEREPYGSGGGDHENLLLDPVHDLPCVGCGLERAIKDWEPRIATRNHHDDGLCNGCRETGVSGIPPHHSAERIAARAAHIAQTRPPAEALGFLRRDVARLPLGARTTLIDWVHSNGLVQAAERAAAKERTPDVDHNPLRALSDAALRTTHDEVRQQLILLGSTDAAFEALTGTPDRGSDRGREAAEMIVYARARAEEVAQLRTQVSRLRSVTTDLRAQLAAAKPTVRRLQDQLDSLSLAAPRNQAKLETAQREAEQAHQAAVRLAGPPERWEALVSADPPTEPLSEAEDTQRRHAVEAIAYAQTRATEVMALRTKCEQDSQATATLRAELDTAEPNAQRLADDLETRTRDKNNLVDQLRTEQRSADEAHRNAEQLAGPPEGWDAIVANPGRLPVSQSQHSADTTHDQEAADLQAQLEDIEAEIARREKLSPEERQQETGPHPTEIDQTATEQTPDQEATTALSDDLGL